MELIATCGFGLEKLVADELKNLGLWDMKTEDGRVTFKGDQLELIRANLWLRCAGRIQIKISEFTAATFDQLFDQINSLEWEKYIGVGDAFPIKATSVKSVLHSEPAIQSIVKKAIVKRLQEKHKVEILPEDSGAVFQIVVKVSKNQFLICMDSSGASLHRRGYRLQANAAPLRETLAAAMVELSDWKSTRTLVDTFCGSGTIVIEAALIAQNIAPGLKREFAFQKWPWIDQKKIAEAYAEVRKSALPPKKLPIFCFDIDPSALVMAKENAFRAGIEEINFKRSDFNNLDFSRFENCTFIINPPYGERLEEKTHVYEMYRQFGECFAKTKNCSLFVLTSNENFPRLFGRPADKNRKLFNGPIRCYFFSYFSKK